MTNEVSLTIPSHPQYLSIVRAVIGMLGELQGMPKKEIDTIKLGVDEACSNVIKYAYRGDTGKRIAVKCKITRKIFEIIIEDSGIKARPESIMGRSLEEIRPGGLGVHLIGRAFDSCLYDEKKKRGNRLILTKHRKKENAY